MASTGSAEKLLAAALRQSRNSMIHMPVPSSRSGSLLADYHPDHRPSEVVSSTNDMAISADEDSAISSHTQPAALASRQASSHQVTVSKSTSDSMTSEMSETSESTSTARQQSLATNKIISESSDKDSEEQIISDQESRAISPSNLFPLFFNFFFFTNIFIRCKSSSTVTDSRRG